MIVGTFFAFFCTGTSTGPSRKESMTGAPPPKKNNNIYIYIYVYIYNKNQKRHDGGVVCYNALASLQDYRLQRWVVVKFLWLLSILRHLVSRGLKNGPQF